MFPEALSAIVNTPMMGKHAPMVFTAVTTKVFLCVHNDS